MKLCLRVELQILQEYLHVIGQGKVGEERCKHLPSLKATAEPCSKMMLWTLWGNRRCFCPPELKDGLYAALCAKWDLEVRACILKYSTEPSASETPFHWPSKSHPQSCIFSSLQFEFLWTTGNLPERGKVLFPHIKKAMLLCLHRCFK